jgi:phosphate transport system permease protein
MSQRKTFTGVLRQRKTRWSVRLGDVVSRWCITVGGIGTIVAVAAVFVFLGYVVWPLFESSRVDGARTVESPAGQGRDPIQRLAVDEYGVIGWTLSQDGALCVFRTDTGEVLERRDVTKGSRITAASFLLESPDVALGFADGTVRQGRIAFSTRFVEPESLPPTLQALTEGQRTVHEGGIVERTAQGQLRLQKVDVALKDAVHIATAPVMLIDQVLQEGKSRFCSLSADGKLQLSRVSERRNLLTDEVILKADKNDLPYRPRFGAPPSHLRLLGHGEAVLLIWEDGFAQRIDCRDPANPAVVEELDLVADPAGRVTAVEQLLGRRTILVGDSTGRAGAWFGVRPKEGTQVSDGVELTRAHELRGPDAAVTSLAASSRNRLALAGYANGEICMFQVTNAETLVRTATGEAFVVTVAIGPKDDRLYALAGNRLWLAELDPKHPEASWSSMFLPIHYEDYPRPEHVWQSTGGTPDFEPKLGLLPLVIGTLKATFYSMLLGAPLALLAAMYTSEFMHPRWRARIKPTIELMASLPSVVLGFLAGNVLAPLAERAVPELLTAAAAVPCLVLLGAFLWQLLPQRQALLWRWLRLPLIALAAVPAGIALSWRLGPAVERWLFSADVMRWLDGQVGSGFGGWMLLLLPISALVVALAMGGVVNPWIRSLRLPGRGSAAAANLLKFLTACAATLALAAAASALLALAWDPRGPHVYHYLDTYIQRNALVVGFMMGFAIIPIIYTIAEDALSTVPEHLRSASLGTGATHWQTAVRIVAPTAMSGLFSAMMIGLGRAVGETMIVLMAAGNTPVMKMNLFDGFRTLSANIAVELPEAARDSTHYRVLFFAALVLFVMTFCVNTLAEIVRLRFRRRAYQL